MDVQSIAILAGIVAVVAILLYVYDRKSRKTEVSWIDGMKIALGAGSVAGSVAVAVGGGDVAVADAVPSAVTHAVAETAQEMFVGVPDF